MTKEQFAKQKWGYGMIIEYRDNAKGSSSLLIADVISVDFENFTIGVELPIAKDLVFLPCEKCTIIKDFEHNAKQG